MDHSFAYVDFGTAEAKEAAIAKSEGHLDGRRLLIKDGTYVPVMRWPALFNAS
jgi:hypothetical protein